MFYIKPNKFPENENINTILLKILTQEILTDFTILYFLFSLSVFLSTYYYLLIYLN